MHWLACRDGYKPEFTAWAGDRFRGQCVLDGDIALLRDWSPMTTSAVGGAPALDVCINDTQCEDGDVLAVSVNGREVMRQEIFNRESCRRVQVANGTNNISIFAVNVISLRMPAGTWSVAQVRTAFSMCAGSCPATSRKESFTIAEDGMIVLLPGPW